ncbi:rCG58716, partial [Rattus norvegicus]
MPRLNRAKSTRNQQTFQIPWKVPQQADYRKAMGTSCRRPGAIRTDP